MSAQLSEIEFRGYAEDCLIHGRLAVPSDARLTDFLNSADGYPVLGASLHNLEDGSPVPVGDQGLAPDDLWAVEPTDTGVTPWRADLHVSTHPVQIEVELPPYRIVGFLHGLSAADSLEAMHRRRRMVPLTDASIQFTYVGRQITRETRVLIFNRDRAVSIRRLADETDKPGEVGTPSVDRTTSDLPPARAGGSTSSGRC